MFSLLARIRMVPLVPAKNSLYPDASNGLVSLVIRAPRICVLLASRNALETLRPVTSTMPFHLKLPVWNMARSESSTTRMP